MHTSYTNKRGAWLLVVIRMTKIIPIIILASLATSIMGCSTNDIGKDCPQLSQNQPPSTPTQDPTTSNTQNTVEQNVKFPCDNLICVATDGRTGYCSQKCLDNSGCPDGFTCSIVQTLGPFANISLCVWKTCTHTQDCGSSDDFCCEPVPYSMTTKGAGLCAFANKGQKCL